MRLLPAIRGDRSGPRRSAARDPVTPVSQGVANEVVKVYYPAVLASADAARARAQTASTIASAVAAALVAAGIITGIAGAELPVVIAGVATLAGWLLSAALFVYAVAGDVQVPHTSTYSTDTELAAAVIENVRVERDAIRRRSALAQGATSAAMLLTALAIVLALTLREDPDFERGMLSLTDAGAAQVVAACTAGGVSLPGSYDPATLDDQYVTVRPAVGECADGRRELRIRQADVLGIAKDR